MLIQSKGISANKITMRVDTAGNGFPVLLCHGFPESRHCWHKQVPKLAEAGFSVIAPDMRGYGETSAPSNLEDYTLLHLVGDMVGLLDALGHDKAAIVGHDMGAIVAWAAATLRPDKFIAVAGLSVPYTPHHIAPPLEALRRKGMNDFYWLWFREGGPAEAELDANPSESLRRVFWGLSGDAPEPVWTGLISKNGFLDTFPAPPGLPRWLSAKDLKIEAAGFKRGFRGALNWYRNFDRDWTLMSAFAGSRIHQPSMFLAGERDPVVSWAHDAVKSLPHNLPGLISKVLVPGAGHWVQQEAPDIVTKELINFLVRATHSQS
jgi:pimeloyl-ACP methyl ester carboxylesterase